MSSIFKKFKDLHESANLFVLPNVWDAKSALTFQEKQFPAIGTSSAAVASSLGYEDGETMPFADYLFVVKRILSVVQVPLTVDIEMGYGKTDAAIYANIQQLVDQGVAGINIEDSMLNGSGRVLKEAKQFARTIESIKDKLAADKADLFINVRCDTYLLGVADKQEETVCRLRAYEAAGADGIFLPCIVAEDDIAEAVNHTTLPLNVMCFPGLPDFATLQQLGVKRVSMGPFLFNKVYDSAGQLSRAVTTQQSFSPIL